MIVLVVGMHRSGTSMVARTLHGMGMNLGKSVDTTPHPANKNGHWEHADVWQSQEKLLIDFGREWHSCPGPLPANWLAWPETQATIDCFTEIAHAEIACHGNWLVKDPRSSLLLPLWSEVANRLKVELRVLHIFRDCEEVASSLHARQGMPKALAYRIWQEHQKSIERDSKGLICARFDHSDIMRTPQSQLAGMGAFCQLPNPQQLAAACVHLVEQELWHQRNGSDASPPSTETPPAARETAQPALMDCGRVLIVMRTRWRLHFLPRALRSVLSQTYRNWFLQVVNDGGPEHLVESEIAPYRHLFEGRLHILHLSVQRGMEAASNAAIAAQDSEFITIHDDDDTWQPEFLSRMTQWLQEKGASACVSRSHLVLETWHEDHYQIRERTPFGPDLDHITEKDLQSRNLFPPVALLFRRKAIEKIGNFHEGLPALGDWHFNKRLAQIEPLTVCPEHLANWHHRLPQGGAPNSPRGDHLRSYEFVRNWPQTAPLPDFFPQARQVTLWVQEHQLDGFEKKSLPAQGDRPLAAGLYLIGLNLKQGNPSLNFHYSTDASLSLRHSTPLDCASPNRTWLLLNAPVPLQTFGLSHSGDDFQPITGEQLTIRLADPLPSLGDMSRAPRLPDVLGIGAQRSATTWLHTVLQSHPDIWSWGIKEFHQFDWDGTDPESGQFRQTQALAILSKNAIATGDPARDDAVRMALRHGFPVSGPWENYSASIAAAPPHQLVCDFTPAYATLHADKIAEIIRVMPDVKVIFIMRDPVTRALSGALHHLQRSGVQTPTETELNAACDAAFNVARTDYLQTLGAWEKALPAKQLLVMFHEDLAQNPVQWINQVCDFLQIAPLPTAKVHPFAHEQINGVHHHGLSWPMLARVKARLSHRWLPMLIELEPRFGEPVRQWRLAAQARLKSMDLACSPEDEECTAQAILDRYLPLFPRCGIILEIGPGHGRWSERLATLDGLLVCCDISPHCLDATRQRLTGRGRLRTHLCADNDLPADLTARVDAIWSYGCFVHLSAKQCQSYLQEIARVLVPGGHAVIHHADNRNGIGDFLRQKLRGLPGDESGWRSSVSAKAFALWAERAGLHVVRQEAGAGHNNEVIGVPRFGDCITVVQRHRPVR